MSARKGFIQQEFIGVQEMARELGLHPRSMYRWLHRLADKHPVLQLPNRQIVMRRDDFERMKEDLAEPVVRTAARRPRRRE